MKRLFFLKHLRMFKLLLCLFFQFMLCGCSSVQDVVIAQKPEYKLSIWVGDADVPWLLGRLRNLGLSPVAAVTQEGDMMAVSVEFRSRNNMVTARSTIEEAGVFNYLKPYKIYTYEND